MIQTYFDLINLILLLFSIISLGAIAGLLSERTGTVNIAIEAQMTIGALIFSVIGYLNLPIIFAFVCAMLGSITVSLMLGYLTINKKANHAVAGLGLNILISGFSMFVVKVVSKGTGYIPTRYKPWRISFEGIMSIMNYYFIISCILLFFVWYMINKTKHGLRFITTGENPSALLAVGFCPKKQRWIGLILSGIFAGISGAFFTTFVSSNFKGPVYGMGFVALSVLIFGQWRVKSIFIAAMIFSSFNAASYYNLKAFEFIPRNLQLAAPYIITLLVLIRYGKNSRNPKAIGLPLD